MLLSQTVSCVQTLPTDVLLSCLPRWYTLIRIIKEWFHLLAVHLACNTLPHPYNDFEGNINKYIFFQLGRVTVMVETKNKHHSCRVADFIQVVQKAL